MKKLEKLGIRCIELPLIEHAPGKDRDELGETLKAKNFDWTIVTSPEGAVVFTEGTVAVQWLQPSRSVLLENQEKVEK